jgi:neutral ceramidase
MSRLQPFHGDRMARLSLALLGMVLLSVVVAHSQAVGGGSVRAGAHKVAFTPKPSDLPIATDSIRDPLFARAIVVDDGRACAVLIGLDLGAAGNQIVDDAVPRVAAATGCPGQNIIVSATHTHSSNAVGLGQGAPLAKTVADAIVQAATVAKSRLAPARIGYGTTSVDLNVNRDLFNQKLEWRQEPNPSGPSDKTLAVVALVGADNVPIGVYVNYAMHPINFYLSGVISADFPGETSRYVEDLFDDRAVAIFTQGASGDQNPRDFRSPTTFMAQRGRLADGRGPFLQTVGAPADAAAQPGQGFNPQRASSGRQAIPEGNLQAYQKTLARTGDYVRMIGVSLGSAAVRVMRESMRLTHAAAIAASQQTFTCPGRVRLDADNPARENVFPGYKDGPDVNLEVGLLRIGDINLVTVNGEVYSEIAMRLKEESPATRTMMVTLANGSTNAGYIYSDAAYSHLTFQVIGSRLKPGCAEGKIVGAALDLMRRAN